MNEKLNEIKNRVYEVEGLLELAQHRDDKASELLLLIHSRLESVCELLAGMKIETAPQQEAGSEWKNESVIEGESESENDGESDGEVESEADAAPVQTKDVKSLFCLNDRFKFRRIIFGGSDADFNDAMNALSSLPTLADAEEYLYNELGLDQESVEVREFMEVIKNYYGR